MIKVLFIWLAIPFNNNSWKSDTIYWCSTRKLNWKDFKATNPSGNGAMTAKKILVKTKQMDSIYVIDVYPIFFCKRSWSNDTSKSLLIHEQLHFDIAELEARRIRRFLSDKKINGANYLGLYHKIRSMIDFQSKTDDRFDKETGHGFLNDQQVRWRKLIDSQLKALEKFSSKCPP